MRSNIGKFLTHEPASETPISVSEKRWQTMILHFAPEQPNFFCTVFNANTVYTVNLIKFQRQLFIVLEFCIVSHCAIALRGYPLIFTPFVCVTKLISAILIYFFFNTRGSEYWCNSALCDVGIYSMLRTIGCWLKFPLPKPRMQTYFAPTSRSHQINTHILCSFTPFSLSPHVN